MSRVNGGERGAVLLSALGVLVLGFLFLSSFMTLNALRAASIRQEARGLHAYYAARAGAEAGKLFLTRPGENEEASEFGDVIMLEDGGAPAAEDEKVFIHFHERGEGYFSGRIFEDAKCEVSWERARRTESGDEYIIKSTGIITRGGSELSRDTVYAYARESGGVLYITNWFE